MAILDSGERVEFESGAVRDIQEGKGRMDLVPLWNIHMLKLCSKDDRHMQDFGKYIERFISLGDVESLYIAYDCLVASEDKSYAEVLIDISKHFEEGCKKYGENNWRKGIPVKSFLNSALRHLVQHLAGATDEPHMRAACWNLLCLIWTWEHHPECRGEFDKLNSANKTKADENL